MPKLFVQISILRPVIFSLHKDKRWKVEGRVIANVFVLRLVRRGHKILDDSLIQATHVFEGGDKRPNQRKGSASDESGGRVFGKVYVELLQLGP